MLTSLAPVAFTLATAAASQPNIVFIFVDDSGWGDFSCQGNPVLDKLGQPITPNIDPLAAEGMRFTNGYMGIADLFPVPHRLAHGHASLTARHPHFP